MAEKWAIGDRVRTPDGRILVLRENGWQPETPTPTVPQMPPAPPGPTMTMPAGLLEAGLQGATFGGSDEMQAALGAAAAKARSMLPGQPAVDFGAEYGRRQQAIDEAFRGWAEQHPALGLGAGLTGGLATGSGLARLAGAIPGVGPAMARIPGLIRYPAVGAGAGGAAGGLSAPAGERAQGAVAGAALGAPLGAAAPIAGRMVRPIATRVEGTASPQAVGKVAQALARDEVTPARAAARVATRPGSVIADVAGENVLGLARAAQSVPSEAKRRIANFLNRRNFKQAERVLEPLERTLGSGRRYVQTLDDLDVLRREAAAPLYRTAYDRPIEMNDTLRELLARPSMRKALSRVKNLAAEAGEEVPDLDAIIEGREASLSTKGWDYIKRSLDDVVFDEHTDEITGALKPTEEARLANATRKTLLGELDDQNRAYSEARAVWAGPTQAMNAMRKGAAFVRQDADITAKQIARLSDADKSAFRLGVAKAVRDMIERKGDSHDVTKLFDKVGMRRKLRAVFPDEKSFRAFTKSVMEEGRKFATRAAVLGNSVTQRLAQEQQDLARPVSIATSMLLGRPGEALEQTVRAAANLANSSKISPRVAEEVGSMLFHPNPAAVLRALENPALTQPQVAGPLAVGMGSAAGLLAGPR